MITALALFLTPSAEAANVPKIKNVRIRQLLDTNNNVSYRAAILTDSDVSDVSAEVRSDAGDEDLLAVETDAWTRGTTTVTLPTGTAKLVLTVTGAKGEAIGTATGTLDSAGTVSLTGVSGDIDVLAAGTWGSKSTTLAFTLAGSDVYTASSGTLKTIETTKVTTCTGKTCTTSEQTVTRSSTVTWGEIGSVWEADLAAAPEGEVEVRVEASDSRGKKLDQATVDLAPAWLDTGDGTSALGVGADTSVALLGTPDDYSLALVSCGWRRDESQPDTAIFRMDNGEEVEIERVGAQRTVAEVQPLDPSAGAWTIQYHRRGMGGTVTQMAQSIIYAADQGMMVCDPSVCVGVGGANAGGPWVTATVLDDAAELEGLDVDFTGPDGTVQSFAFDLEDEVSLVFAAAVSFDADPVGADFAADVRLLGAAGNSDNDRTMLTGSFAGQFIADEDGFGLGGRDANDIEMASGPRFGGGASEVPVILLRSSGGGKGTRAVATTTNGKPPLL